jgi:RimJ/RimL family protein N-acetyltransferase
MSVPKLGGKRLTLRPPIPGDAGDRLAAGRDPEFRKMVGAVDVHTSPFTRADAERWYDQLCTEPHAWIVEYDETCIGLIRLHDLDGTQSAKLAVGIFVPEHRGIGLGTEAIELVLSHAFGAMKLATIRLRVLAFNLRGITAYRKCGFREVSRELVTLGETQAEDVIMSITAAEFHSQQGIAGRSISPPAG